MNLPPTFAEVCIPITLDRERTMYFNLNTMTQYEEVSKKFYFDTLLTINEKYMEVLAKIPKSELLNPNSSRRMDLLDIIRRVPMKDLHLLIWAATHEYDKQDEPFWPLNTGQIGRLLRPLDLPRLLNAIMVGHTGNSPSKKELGEAPSAAESKTEVETVEVKTPQENGGEQSIGLPEGAFA